MSEMGVETIEEKIVIYADQFGRWWWTHAEYVNGIVSRIIADCPAPYANHDQAQSGAETYEAGLDHDVPISDQ